LHGDPLSPEVLSIKTPFTERARSHPVGNARRSSGQVEGVSSNKASITDGAVGEGVTGVTIHAGTFTVSASVQNGRYVAWWPGPAFRDGPVEPSGKGGPELMLTYDLALTDGTVLRNVQPTRPS
jgi:hypothetical protein